jgi:hypothetical protein
MAIELLKNFIRFGLAEGFDLPGPNWRFMEEGTGWNPNAIIPGHFYTFRQPNPRGNDQLPSLDDYTTGVSKEKPYFDNFPIFLALDQYGRGLNVKIIPQSLRRAVIRAYLKLIMPMLEPLTDDSGNFLDIKKRLESPAIIPFFRISSDLIKQGLFNATPEIKFRFLVDKYNKAEMEGSLRLIDWPHVPKIGEVNYSNDQEIVSRSSFSDYLKIV